MKGTGMIPDVPGWSPASRGSGQLLTFVVAGQQYGVDILCVQEIRGWMPVTPIPNAPRWVQGVLNLRGTIVPVFDLRMRFDLPKLDYDATTVVIVLAIAMPGGGRRVLGVVVDGVSDVLDVTAEQIRPIPDCGDAMQTEFIQGIVSIDERMVVLLDAEKLLSVEELSALGGTRSAPAPGVEP